MKFIQLNVPTSHAPMRVRADQIMMIEVINTTRCRILVGAGPALMEVIHPAAEVESLINGPAPVAYDEKETALILAGLRYLQRDGVGSLHSSIDNILHGAWNYSEYKAIDKAIDVLCEKVNRG